MIAVIFFFFFILSMIISNDAFSLKMNNKLSFSAISGKVSDTPTPYRTDIYNTISKKLITVPLFLSLLVGSSGVNAKDLKTDEIEAIFSSDYLGLGLVELMYKKSRRVMIQSIKDDADVSNPNLKPGLIVVAVGNKTVEQLGLSDIVNCIRSQPRPLKIVFRDPEIFFQKLNSSASTESTISTTIRPEVGDRDEETLIIRRFELPGLCVQPAINGDVLELSYQIRLPDGTLVYGEPSLASADADNNLFLVLGSKGNNEKLPPVFGLLLPGMCIGERRLVSVPASLGYGAEVPRGIKAPSMSPLEIEVRLVSINGVTGSV